MDKLPLDVIRVIRSYLSPSLAQQFRRVCRKFNISFYPFELERLYLNLDPRHSVRKGDLIGIRYQLTLPVSPPMFNDALLYGQLPALELLIGSSTIGFEDFLSHEYSYPNRLKCLLVEIITRDYHSILIYLLSIPIIKHRISERYARASRSIYTYLIEHCVYGHYQVSLEALLALNDLVDYQYLLEAAVKSLNLSLAERALEAGAIRTLDLCEYAVKKKSPELFRLLLDPDWPRYPILLMAAKAGDYLTFIELWEEIILLPGERTALLEASIDSHIRDFILLN